MTAAARVRITGQRVSDGDDIGGDSTKVVTGKVNARAVVEDLLESTDISALAEQLGDEEDEKGRQLSEENFEKLADSIDTANVEVNVDEEGYLRRVFADLAFTLPEDLDSGNIEKGKITFELVLEEIGVEVNVAAPPDPRPMSSLFGMLGGLFGIEKPSDLWLPPELYAAIALYEKLGFSRVPVMAVKRKNAPEKLGIGAPTLLQLLMQVILALWR